MTLLSSVEATLGVSRGVGASTSCDGGASAPCDGGASTSCDGGAGISLDTAHTSRIFPLNTSLDACAIGSLSTATLGRPAGRATVPGIGRCLRTPACRWRAEIKPASPAPFKLNSNISMATAIMLPVMHDSTRRTFPGASLETLLGADIPRSFELTCERSAFCGITCPL